MRRNRVKQALKRGEPQVGTWLSLINPMAGRFLSRLPFAWLTLDMEHSPYSWESAGIMLGQIADVDGIPLVRVPCADHQLIKRALDGGAHGVVVPMVMDRAQAEMCVAACLYPPAGNRSVGGQLHAINFNASPDDYYRHANDELLIVLQCEHIDAVRRADEIFSVPGIDAIFVGPNDLWASMRSSVDEPVDHVAFETALADILAACKRHHVAAGIHCFSAEDVNKRIKQGWQFLALGSDLSLLLKGAQSELKQLQLPEQATGKSLANY